MPPTGQIVPSSAERDSELIAARQVSMQRIESYKQSDNLAKRHGAMTREIGRIAGRDPEFALELAEGFEVPVRANALTVIGKITEDLGVLSEARAIAESEDFTPAQQSDKLSKIAEAAVKVDPIFAFETATAIPLPARRADALIEVAKKSKQVYMRESRSYNYPPRVEMREESEDTNFSLGLFKQIVRAADRTIDEHSLWDEYRNRQLAEVSGELDLRTTYHAELRQGSSVSFALFVIGRHIKGYIDKDQFIELEAADPDGELTIGAFKARIDSIREPGNENDRLTRSLLRGGDPLDPVVDAAKLLRDLKIEKNMRFQHTRPQFYENLLSVIEEGASAEAARFRSEQEAQSEEEERAPALDGF